MDMSDEVYGNLIELRQELAEIHKAWRVCLERINDMLGVE